MLVASLKYITLVLRADNRGEGGTLALTELAVRGLTGRRKTVLTILGLIGASLFYGDSMITPALSVLSSSEGIGILSNRLEPWLLLVSLVVLAGLFLDRRSVRSCKCLLVRVNHVGPPYPKTK